MNSRIEKSKLLEILTTNRTAHRGIFEEAVEGYRKKATQMLNENLDAIKANKNHRVGIYLPVPEDHTRDYDRAIQMVNMTTDAEIVLAEQDFKSFVMDDWAWANQFLTSNSAYSEGAAAALADRKAAGEDDE